MTSNKASSSVRFLEIVLGLIAVSVGALVIFYPGWTIVTITFLLAIALLLVGLFRFFWGFAARGISGGARGAAILIGIIAIVIAVMIMAFPVFATETAVILIDIGVLIYAVGRIAIGAGARGESAGLRGLQITLGALMLIIGMTVLFFPWLGVAFLGFLLAIAFLVIGFEGIAAGIVGKQYAPQIPNYAT